MNSKKKYEIKLETGIKNGSISIWSDEILIDFLAGEEGERKNDSVLDKISELLDKNYVLKDDIKRIIYSNYPVSQTGLKVLTSILKVFKMILDVEILEKNLFNAIARFNIENLTAANLIILPVSKNDLEYYVFDKKGERLENGKFDRQILENYSRQEMTVLTTNETIESFSPIFYEMYIVALDNNLSKYL